MRLICYRPIVPNSQTRRCSIASLMNTLQDLSESPDLSGTTKSSLAILIVRRRATWSIENDA